MLKQLIVFTLFMLGMAGICHAQDPTVWRNFGATNSSEGSITPGTLKLTKYKKNNIRVLTLDTAGIVRDTNITAILDTSIFQLKSNMVDNIQNVSGTYPNSAAVYTELLSKVGYTDTTLLIETHHRSDSLFLASSTSNLKGTADTSVTPVAVSGNWYWLKNYPVTVTYTKFGGISVATTESSAAIYNGTTWQEYNPPVDALLTATVATLDTIKKYSLQLSNNYASGNMVGVSIATSGSRSSSANWLSTQAFAVVPGEIYTISGMPGSLSTSVVRVMFYKANGNDSVGGTTIMGNNTRNPVTFTVPVNAAWFRVVLATGTNVSTTLLATARNNFMLNSGSYAAPFQEYGSIAKYERQERKPSVIYFSWTSGNDTTGLGYDINSPVRTRDRANQLVDPQGVIVPLEGDHYITGNSFDMSKQPAGGERPVQGTRVRYLLAPTMLTSFTKTSGQTYIYQATYTGSYNSTYWMWQHDTSDVRTLIADTARFAADNGSTYRLTSTKLTNRVSLTDLDTAAANGNWGWYLDDPNNILYVTSPTTNYATYPIVIPYVGGFLTSTVQKPLRFDNIDFLYGGVNFSRTTPYIVDCKFNFNNLEGACKFDNTVGAMFINCSAKGSRNDGFNAHVTSTPTYIYSNQNTATLINPYATDCGDDGISTHEYSKILLINPTINFNDQGGTAASGAHWTVLGGTFYGNRGNGLVAQGSALDGGNGTQITASGVLSAYNGVNFAGQGSGGTTSLTNCVSKYARTTYYGSGLRLDNCTILPYPVFADNSAALAGSLVAGQYYRTSIGVVQVVY